MVEIEKSRKYNVDLRQIVIKESGMTWKDIDAIDVFDYYYIVDNIFAAIEKRNKINE